ncbi:MAG: N-6 DNA methylase [Myxococcota bacterium]
MDRLVPRITDEAVLTVLSLALGAATVPAVGEKKFTFLDSAADVPDDLIAATLEQIRLGNDPLGTAFCNIRPASRRREDGAVYTPSVIVDAMLSRVEILGEPDRVVDPGAGSGRFLVEVGRRFPNAFLVAVERDPLAALTTRANLAASGMADRSEVRIENFLTSNLGQVNGRTLFIGNPPYVRHHLIPAKWKTWLKDQANAIGLQASALAGMHVYFFLAIARCAGPGDYGALITAAEWLDVNYGQLVRELFLSCLGGQSVHVIEPAAEPFPKTATTAAITTFTVNSKPSLVRFARVADLSCLGDLGGGRRVRRERLASEQKWSHFTHPAVVTPKGYVELGELCRVHRGQVTGANHIWIAGEHSQGLPDRVLFPAVTRARELIQTEPLLASTDGLRLVIDLPEDLSTLDGQSLAAVERFLVRAEKMGAKEGYVARHRLAWWSVRLRDPAPVLATYMARRPPAFVLNETGARHLNIAHGLYPRESMSPSLLSKLVSYLRQSSLVRGGRVYAGGLTKFEPREMERIPVPEPSLLMEMTM